MILHRQSKFNPDLGLQTMYNRYRNFCSPILKKVKRNYEKDLIQKAGKDSRKLWNTIKLITNTSKDTQFLKSYSIYQVRLNHLLTIPMTIFVKLVEMYPKKQLRNQQQV